MENPLDTIIPGDCVTVLPTLPEACAQAIEDYLAHYRLQIFAIPPSSHAPPHPHDPTGGQV